MTGTISRAVGSIMDHFRTPVATNAPTAPVAPAEPSAAASAAANPTVPSSSTPTSDGKGPGAFPAVEKTGEKSPLDGFQDLWQIDDKDRKQLPPVAPQIAVDPKKMQDAAKALDFSKAIDPEAAKKALAGDTEAFAGILNEVARAATVQASAASARVTEAALKAQSDAFQARIPEILRTHEASVGLRQDTQVYDNPALAPLVSLVETQMAAKYPNATPEQLRKQTNDFLQGAASSIVGSTGKQIIDPAPTGGKNVRKETDWTKFLE